MALQDILQKILKEAQNKVAELDKEFAEESKKLEKDFEQKQADQLTELDKKKEVALEKIVAESSAMARRKSKQLSVSAKNKIINEALEKFSQFLENLSGADYEAFIARLFSHVDVNEGTVIVSDKHLAASKKVITGNFQFQASKDISGGFIVKSGAFEIDNSFQNLVFSEFKSELESFFAQKLELV